MSEAERLEARFRKMKTNGLLDLKLSFGPLEDGVTVEQLCGEVNEVLDAVEAGRFKDLPIPVQIEPGGLIIGVTRSRRADGSTYYSSPDLPGFHFISAPGEAPGGPLRAALKQFLEYYVPAKLQQSEA